MYSVEKRKKPLLTMMIVAIAITTKLSGWINTLKLPVPSASEFLIFTILYWVFDNWLWRWSIFRLLFAISAPNLAGTWRGILKSNTNGKELDITLYIRQSWSKISVAISFDNSTSSSICATILCSQALPKLIYTYENIPHHRESDTMTRHIGTAELTLNNNCLNGNYFTSGDRKTEGQISVVRI